MFHAPEGHDGGNAGAFMARDERWPEESEASMDRRENEPVLSMVVTGRNDDYMGNFKYRITSCLNFAARNLAQLGLLDEVELLVTDWGSEVPLSQVLPLTPEAALITRFFHVPRAVAGERFCPVVATNVALRRGRGRFLMLFDADSLVPRFALRNLVDALAGRVPAPFDLERNLMLFSRYHVPFETCQHELVLEAWEPYLSRAAGVIPREQALSGLGGSSAGLLMHRDRWYEVGAFDEKLTLNGWSDADLAMRVTQRYGWIDLSCLGVGAFHQEHWPTNKRGLWPGGVNPRTVAREMRVNPEGWGMADAPIAEQQSDPSSPKVEIRSAPPARLSVAEAKRAATRPEVMKHVTWNAGLAMTSAPEWEAACALAAQSLRRPPFTFVEYGMEESCLSTLVAATNPGLEIYVIDDWQRRCPEDVLVLLREVGYVGYTRLVTGDPSTGFTRLAGSLPAPFKVDLALVRTSMLGSDGPTKLLDIAGHLSATGALCVIARSTAEFATHWEGLRSAYPACAFLMGLSGRTGIMLAEQVAEPATITVDYGAPRRPSLVRRMTGMARAMYKRLLGR